MTGLASAKVLDAGGRCCGVRPMRFARTALVCPKCRAAFTAFGAQCANWAWRVVDGGFEPTSAALAVTPALRQEAALG